jgi:hypothetical protein
MEFYHFIWKILKLKELFSKKAQAKFLATPLQESNAILKGFLVLIVLPHVS